MRLRFRLRTALIAVALLSPPLACVAVVARHGGIAGFQNHHAQEAYNNWAAADDLQGRAEHLQKHGTPADAKRIEESRRRAAAYLRDAHWHEFLSGRPIMKVRL